MRIKKFVLFLRLIANFVLLRPFGSIINDIVRNTNGELELSDLRKLEKLRIKLRKAEHDLFFIVYIFSMCIYYSFTLYFLHFIENF